MKQNEKQKQMQNQVQNQVQYMQKHIQKQSRARIRLQNRLQIKENSNACAPVNTICRLRAQNTYVLDGRTYKPAGGVL